VKLAVIISVEFMVKNPLGLFDFGDILSDTGSDESILEPTIRSFNLTFGLGRKGVNDLHIAVLQNLFPMRGGLIGEKMVFSPEGVPSLDKSKDRVGIDIISIRKPILKDGGLEGQDMGPSRFFLHQSCIKEEPAIIIQGSDQIPFLPSRRCPEMKGSIMLDQFSGVMG
jgi:hypothetical protein